MIAFARVGMLVKRRAVELRQAVLIGGEMPHHPVEYHADARRVGGLNQMLQLLRRAEAAGGRIKAGGLIAP